MLHARALLPALVPVLVLVLAACGASGTSWPSVGPTAAPPPPSSPPPPSPPSNDVSPPTVPANLVASPGINAISLYWGASSDDIGVEGYTVSRNGSVLATRAATGYLDTGLLANTSYTYEVSAFDAAGNSSAAASATAGTLAPGTATQFAQLAASLQPGQWANFTTGNFDLALVDAGQSRSIFEYATRGHWDPVNKKIQFWGQGHYAGQALITYDEATNTWSKDTTVVNPGIGHNFQHLALNPANGDLFLRLYNSGEIRWKPYGQAWQTAAPFNNINAQVSGALEWVPQLNNGAGGLAFADTGGVRFSNAAVTSWGSQIDAASAPYGQNGVAINGAFYFGGGGNSVAFWRLNANGTITDVADPPVAYSNSPSAPRLIPHPNGIDALVVDPSAAGNVYTYNAVQNTWTNSGQQQLGTVVWDVGITVPEYGVTVWLCQSSSVSTPFIRVFKP